MLPATGSTCCQNYNSRNISAIGVLGWGSTCCQNSNNRNVSAMLPGTARAVSHSTVVARSTCCQNSNGRNISAIGILTARAPSHSTCCAARAVAERAVSHSTCCAARVVAGSSCCGWQHVLWLAARAVVDSTCCGWQHTVYGRHFAHVRSVRVWVCGCTSRARQKCPRLGVWLCLPLF